MTPLSRWGSHLVVPSTGILLNKAIMWCDPIPGRPNRLAPGTTPLANMAPVVVTRQGKLQGLIGSSGGRKIMGANSQVLYNLIYHTLDPQTANHTPRIDFSTVPITVDGRLPKDVGSALARELGVQVETLNPDLGKSQFASPVVVWGNSGNWSGGIDPYGMGIAVSE